MTYKQRSDHFVENVSGAAWRLVRWGCAMAVLAVAASINVPALAGDWPTYRHDVARSGVTAEKVSPPLEQSWVFQSRHAPRPAWGDPKPGPVENILELRRVHFDDAFQPVAAGGAVYFGSSADHKVYCLDGATGRIRWTHFTGGPVRLAPMIAGGRVYVGSDDGHAYCLDAADGSVLWRFRAAPEDSRVLGHGKMISLWPLRTGVLVDGPTAYFSAGIFPGEGVFLYAVNAADGSETWRNDTCGQTPQSKISPQGYLLASESSLYVPMGRVSPAAFDRSNGRLAASSPFFGKTVGGTYALLAGDQMYTGTEEIVGYGAATRGRFATFAGRKMVVTDRVAYLASNTELIAMDRTEGRSVLWKTPCQCADSLILAGDVLFAGGNARVIGVDVKTGEQIWRADVEGIAKGLAAAGGRLLVSTDRGLIYSFAPKGSPQHGSVAEPTDKDPFKGSPHAAMFSQAAETILKETGVRRGFCLVLGVETGQLALELARRSDLMIYAVSPDARKVAAARKALDAAGVYGARVCVDRWPPDKVPYSDYFANLVVSETAMVTGEIPGDPGEMLRMLKPIGGTIMIGQPAEPAKDAKPLGADALRAWLRQSKLEGGQVIAEAGAWVKITRGRLPGAGDWTHQYAEPGNTACGDDQLVNAPLGVLWFGRPGPGEMVNRHARAAGPLSLDGRMFVQGENVVSAYDAYNGLELWRREIPGAMRVTLSHDCGNLAVSRDGLFLAVADKCLRLDPATGETMATYWLPPGGNEKQQLWAYVARVGNLLVGSRTVYRRESDCLFAVDVTTGKQKWIYDGGRIAHNTIAIDDGQVLLVNTRVTPEQRKAKIEQLRAAAAQLPESERAEAEKNLAEADVRRLVSLDLSTGAVQWEKLVDLTDCGGQTKSPIPQNKGIPAAMVHDGVLVLFGMYLDGHYWEQFFAGQFGSRRITAVSAKDGKQLWSQRIAFRVRPVIVGDTLHAEPWAFDLHTGQPRTRVHPVTGQTERWQFARPGHHCGCPAAAPNCLFFRSYNLGYYDLKGDYGTMHFGAQRPGCWINFIPAGGLLLMPEASAGCMCAFPNMCSIVFKPTDKLKGFGMYSAVGPMTPVKRLAINFGAPGDRNDAAGNLWLGFPRPYTGRLVLPLKIDASLPGGRFVAGNAAYTPIQGTDDPWLFASAAVGLQECSIPCLAEDDGIALYRVRLAFADPDNDQPGQRVFDIKLQGKLVEEGFDVVRAAGGRNRAVFREFDGVRVSDKLLVELVPQADKPRPEQLPILQGVEIVRQRVVGLGCSVPDFELSSMAPKQSGEMKLANLRQQPFEGTLQVSAPDGFGATPARTQIKLAAGRRATIPIEAAVKQDVPAGQYLVDVKLLHGDGTLELQRTARIQHLGRRGRTVLHPVEDTYVSHGSPERNYGGAGTMLVDGGDKKTGDHHHNLAYLKFRVDVPGKPVSVRLRIYNTGNPTGDSGRVCLVTEPWSEKTVTYATRPAPGKELARLGRVASRQAVECALAVELKGKDELNLMIDPTSRDGVDYLTRETTKPAELIVEYEP